MSAERELIREAREILETRGWIQGAEETPDGLCLRGALLGARADFKTYVSCLRILFAKLGRESITLWNDQPGRTYEEVIWLLKEVEYTLP